MYVNSSVLYGPCKHRTHRKKVLSIGHCFLQQTHTQCLWSVQSTEQGDDNAPTVTVAVSPTAPGGLPVLTPISRTKPNS